ncbi:hypothetical protein ACFWGD_06325 [Corynebacterium sp. NPDC060344]|uniref:hypothetical protein n=1 Tax=Corynebacterium sp. NPDC060344 TaxID=3347101 RepID=UPI00364DDA31
MIELVFLYENISKNSKYDQVNTAAIEDGAVAIKSFIERAMISGRGVQLTTRFERVEDVISASRRHNSRETMRFYIWLVPWPANALRHESDVPDSVLNHQSHFFRYGQLKGMEMERGNVLVVKLMVDAAVEYRLEDILLHPIYRVEAGGWHLAAAWAAARFFINKSLNLCMRELMAILRADSTTLLRNRATGIETVVPWRKAYGTIAYNRISIVDVIKPGPTVSGADTSYCVILQEYVRKTRKVVSMGVYLEYFRGTSIFNLFDDLNGAHPLYRGQISGIRMTPIDDAQGRAPSVFDLLHLDALLVLPATSQELENFLVNPHPKAVMKRLENLGALGLKDYVKFMAGHGLSDIDPYVRLDEKTSS